MPTAPLASLIIFCAALAACADRTANRALPAPDAPPALSEASTDYDASYTLDGAADASLSAGLASAQNAASTQAASGGRASGHVGLNAGLPGFGIASEHYSFTALSIDPSTPFAAKGQYEFTVTTTSGRQNRIQGDVICVGFAGNTARVAGQITKLWVNNVPTPIPARPHNYWVMLDNGEGAGTVDQVSPMAFAIAAGAQAHCAAGLPSIVFPNQEGNVQVQP